MSTLTEPKTPYELFHIECGKGWEGLYRPLLDLCKLKGISVMQVKEKFGGLRFYIGGYAAEQDISMLIRAAEAHSYHTCEDCGEDGILRHIRQEDGYYKPIYKATVGASRTSGWMRTLCEPCREKWDASRGVGL